MLTNGVMIRWIKCINNGWLGQPSEIKYNIYCIFNFWFKKKEIKKHLAPNLKTIIVYGQNTIATLTYFFVVLLEVFSVQV